MSVLRSRRRRASLEDQKTFWLEFQVCHDGVTPFPDSLPSSMSPSSSSPATFPLFPTLPSELRLKIWEQLLQPRIVIVACFDAQDVAPKRAQLARRRDLRRAPVLLHICAETRALALRHYELAFSWRVPGILAAPRSCGPRVWFDFSSDALLLLGELEPYDSSNINAPMVYFLSRADTHRVRHVACAFEELHLGEVEAEQIFGSLFHVIDGFPAAERLLITSTEDDLKRQAEARGGMPLDFGIGRAENIVQKIWWGWINGTSVVTSRMRDKQILMVREDGLADFVVEHA
ncbi:hypothetical protein M406DRAFT_256464 [Cryphonectria parasitica EP155]|uniref:2EXR domain-containing protein n=1 Tax=Cryphonectria parasitica (strain ATCC 38755 / EP155) TaxID=660469 RepID=A0A9P4Y4Q4_CRYP1|nr:uncharacterized protein M406DRAFT_256464 [Cryphonectria parasitica EP155]KAF3766317.1 hypothetical protein M406DRAFT_256464 [Cryphonectria parasitica EP155]